MAAFAPWEPAPAIAVACSGGPDSLALLALTARWAGRLGGETHALIVDHGLRPESADEAAQAAVEASLLGATAQTLRWGPPPGATQAAARAARYRLLGKACAQRGLLHLLTAHHAEDWAETLAMRLARGPDPFAAAAIEPQATAFFGRIVRPVLNWPRARLRAAFPADARPVDDPSNRNARFERPRWRAAAPALGAAGAGRDRLCTAAAAAAMWRAGVERDMAAFAAAAIRPHPAGFILFSRPALAAAPPLLAARLFARMAQAVAGREQPPRPKAAEAALARCVAEGWRGGSFAGCRLAPQGPDAVIAPEVRPRPMALKAGETMLWAGRWRLCARRPGLHVAPLAAIGVKPGFARAADPARARAAIPAIARPTLPILLDSDGPVAIPALRWRRGDEAGATIMLATPRPFATIWAGGLLGAEIDAHYLE